MGKKRSTGILVFGILLIIYFISIGLLILDPDSILDAYSNPQGIIFYILFIICVIIGLVCGIKILQLKEWARKCIVIIMLFNIVIAPIEYFSRNKEYFDSLYKLDRQQLEKEIERGFKRRNIDINKLPSDKQQLFRNKLDVEVEVTINRVNKILKVLFYLIQIGTLLWFLLIIYFFTRSKVKEQFE